MGDFTVFQGRQDSCFFRKQEFLRRLHYPADTNSTLFYPQELKKKLHLILDKKEQTKLLKRQEQWAALKPRASQFGAPVIFQNTPSQSAQQDQSTPQQDPSIHPPSLKTSADRQSERDEMVQTEKLQKEEQQLLDHIIKQVQKEEKTIWKTPSTSSATQSAQGERDTKQQEEKLPAPSKKILIQKEQTPQPKPVAKKQLTLADITKGFIHQLKNEGNNTIKVDGDSNKLPTDEQLKHERYIQRLVWCLQNSLKIHHKYIQNVQNATDPEVFMVLSEKGKLEDVRIVRTSKNQELDLFMLFVFKDASSAFPPVPKYLNKKGYRIVFRIDLGNQYRSNIRYSYQ